MLFDGSEKELKVLINDSLIDMKHRKYKIVEERISSQEELFMNCPSFFDLIHLKIRSILKQISDSMNLKIDFLKYSTQQIDKCIINAHDNLKLLINVSNQNSSEQFEVITLLYLELAYISSFISKKKTESNYDSLAFNCLGLNLMKLFLQRVPYPSNPRTYYYYQQNMLLVSKQLIDDRNYGTAKSYQFNCLQIAIQALWLIDKERKDFLYAPYFKRLMEGIVITLLHRGICEENLLNVKQALEAYKQAKYFSSFLDIEQTDLFLFDLCDKVFQIALGLFGDQIIQPESLLIKKQELIPSDKAQKVFSICHGFTYDLNRLKVRERELNKKLFNKSHHNGKDYLLLFVDDHMKEYRHFSPESKSNLAHYSLFNKLLSPNYKEYVAMTNNFEYDHPNKQKENIEAIEKYINSKIDLKSNTQKNKDKVDTQLSNDASNTNTKSNGNKSKYLSTSTSIFSTQTPSKQAYNSTNLHSFTCKDQPVTQEEKYIFSNNFKAKINHIDSLSNKELAFQKVMLRLKAINSPKPKTELSELSKVNEEAYQTFNLLKAKVAVQKTERRESIIKRIALFSNINAMSNALKQGGLIKVSRNEKRVSSSKIKSELEGKEGDLDNFNRRNYIKAANVDKIAKLSREIEDMDRNIKSSVNTNRNRKKIKPSFSR